MDICAKESVEERVSCLNNFNIVIACMSISKIWRSELHSREKSYWMGGLDMIINLIKLLRIKPERFVHLALNRIHKWINTGSGRNWTVVRLAFVIQIQTNAAEIWFHGRLFMEIYVRSLQFGQNSEREFEFSNALSIFQVKIMTNGTSVSEYSVPTAICCCPQKSTEIWA